MASIISRIRTALPKRRATRVYDVQNFEPLIAYLEEYLTPLGTIVGKLTDNTPGLAWVQVAGQALSKTEFPELYAEMGGMYGEDEDTFNLPDLTDAYLTGVGNTDAGLSVGTNSLQLLIDNIPSHTHDITDPGHGHEFSGGTHTHTVEDPGHSHAVTDPGHSHTSGTATAATGTTGPDAGSASGSTSPATTGISIATETTGIEIGSAETVGTVEEAQTGISLAETGGSQAFNNRPKSVAVYYFIKARF